MWARIPENSPGKQALGGEARRQKSRERHAQRLAHLAAEGRRRWTYAGASSLAETVGARRYVRLMLELEWIGDLDGDAACVAVTDAQAELLQAEADASSTWPRTGPTCTPVRRWPTSAAGPGGGCCRAWSGRSRWVRTGRRWWRSSRRWSSVRCSGWVTSPRTIWSADALNVRHRHPQLWAALAEGRGRVWQARKVAQSCAAAGLDLEQARWVDAVTTPYVASLPWGRFESLVEAKIIEADPRGCGGAGEGGGDGAVRAHRPVVRVRDQDAHRPRQRGGCDLLPGDGGPDRPDPAPPGRHGHRRCAAVQGGRDPRLSSSGARAAGVGRPTGHRGQRRSWPRRGRRRGCRRQRWRQSWRRDPRRLRWRGQHERRR